MDWGSAVFAPELDLILRFSGGHSAYSGTAPQVYDVKTDRYSIPFAPEYPIEYVYSNDQVHGEWSFKGNPWMTGHTYKSTGYDPNLKCLVFAPHEYTYFFDPEDRQVVAQQRAEPVSAELLHRHASAPRRRERSSGPTSARAAPACGGSTPSTRTWKPLPLTGALPAKSPDQHGMAYDSKRDRLLFFSNADKNKGDVAAYDFKTGEAKWLDAAGKDKAAVPSRETIYLPELDAVLIGARVSVDGKQLWAALRLRQERLVRRRAARRRPDRQGHAGQLLQQLDGPDVRPEPQAGLGRRPEQPRACAAAGWQERQVARTQVNSPRRFARNGLRFAHGRCCFTFNRHAPRSGSCPHRRSAGASAVPVSRSTWKTASLPEPSPAARTKRPSGSMSNERGVFSVGVWPRAVSLPAAVDGEAGQAVVAAVGDPDELAARMHLHLGRGVLALEVGRQGRQRLHRLQPGCRVEAVGGDAAALLVGSEGEVLRRMEGQVPRAGLVACRPAPCRPRSACPSPRRAETGRPRWARRAARTRSGCRGRWRCSGPSSPSPPSARPASGSCRPR